MALASIQAALAQYNANIPWHVSKSAAMAALEAVQYLLINRPQHGSDQGADMNFESLAGEKASLEKFLGATAPRAFGRSRRVSASFGRASIQ